MDFKLPFINYHNRLWLRYEFITRGLTPSFWVYGQASNTWSKIPLKRPATPQSNLFKNAAIYFIILFSTSSCRAAYHCKTIEVGIAPHIICLTSTSAMAEQQPLYSTTSVPFDQATKTRIFSWMCMFLTNILRSTSLLRTSKALLSYLQNIFSMFNV